MIVPATIEYVAAFLSAARTLVCDAWSALRADRAGVELTLTTPEPETALALLVAGEPTWPLPEDLLRLMGYASAHGYGLIGDRLDPLTAIRPGEA